MKVRTIFFDCGDTLARMTTSPEEIWLQLAGALGLHNDRESLRQAHAEVSHFMTSLLYEYQGRMNEFWPVFDGRILEKLGIPDRDGRLARAIHQGFAQGNWFQAFQETHTVLDLLQLRAYQLGVISNATDDLIKHLQDLELTNSFDSITYSQEARAEKPQPAIFRLALTRAHCDPHEAVHVGNSYEHDVVGARSVGMTPILLDRGNQYRAADCWRIASLSALESLLASIGALRA